MNATFGISALVDNVCFYRQLRIVSIKLAGKTLAPPYVGEMTKSTDNQNFVVDFAIDSEHIDITPKQLVPSPRVICPIIDGHVPGFTIASVRWTSNYRLEFFVYSYSMQAIDSGHFQFQKVLNYDGVARWTNPAL